MDPSDDRMQMCIITVNRDDPWFMYGFYLFICFLQATTLSISLSNGFAQPMCTLHGSHQDEWMLSRHDENARKLATSVFVYVKQIFRLTFSLVFGALQWRQPLQRTRLSQHHHHCHTHTAAASTFKRTTCARLNNTRRSRNYNPDQSAVKRAACLAQSKRNNYIDTLRHCKKKRERKKKRQSPPKTHTTVSETDIENWKQCKNTHTQSTTNKTHQMEKQKKQRNEEEEEKTRPNE